MGKPLEPTEILKPGEKSAAETPGYKEDMIVCQELRKQGYTPQVPHHHVGKQQTCLFCGAGPSEPIHDHLIVELFGEQKRRIDKYVQRNLQHIRVPRYPFKP